ncbi:hypothetical protein MVAC_00500 [Mycolicibacterium vaccae ATCC 25954]|uniref:Uncharacterized protein n=2 Tax=Mycolicibacterium vaccae TaxID=1810 RepID=K0V605_MYCVA|nr:hypothetical protein MVAC_00500 [Mycolicibacterium vaccae ATCC 25954]
MSVMFVSYLQVPTLLGFGRYTVTLELPASAGLYRFGNVTVRGVQIGKVTEVVPTSAGAQATLVLDTSPRIPADLQAQVRSVSAVGEQYVDLQPRIDGGPYLEDGSVISMRDTALPQQVGPMLDQVGKLVASIPEERLSDLLDESYQGLDGSGADFGSLLDSAATLSEDFGGVSAQTQNLIEDAVPLLDSQAANADSIRQWAHSLAAVTGQLVTNDPEIRSLLRDGPGAFDETARLLDEVKPTLPVLLANLTTVGQIGVTYNPSIEQLLVLLPNYVGQLQTFGMPSSNPTGVSVGDFSLTMSDPPACTVGFLPPSSWRSPADLTEVDTPDGLYCKLPQDSPIAVRGARNYPCMAVPGKRAATVQDCVSDSPFQPLAQRQNALGPYPFDPNLVAQGVPVDDRVGNENTVLDGPLPGTPPPASGIGAVPVAPSSFGTGGSESSPSVAVTGYDPRTGQYVGQGGEVYRQTDLVITQTPRTWKDLLPI